MAKVTSVTIWVVGEEWPINFNGADLELTVKENEGWIAVQQQIQTRTDHVFNWSHVRRYEVTE